MKCNLEFEMKLAQPLLICSQLSHHRYSSRIAGKGYMKAVLITLNSAIQITLASQYKFVKACHKQLKNLTAIYTVGRSFLQCEKEIG